MNRRRLKLWAYRIAPRLAARLQRGLRRGTPPGTALDAAAQAAALAAACGDAVDLPRAVDLAFRHPAVAPNQNRAEILELLRRLERQAPGVLCEIGSAAGGTLFLLSRVARPDARLLSIDLSGGLERERRLAPLLRRGQRLSCIEGDSHDPEVVAQFRRWLGAERLDFLLIDGDHSAAGVEADFETYAPAVRPGGLVALHDIVPDYRARYGVDTGADAGGVPAFWCQLKRRHAPAAELVEHPLQDGRGIGLIEV